MAQPFFALRDVGRFHDLAVRGGNPAAKLHVSISYRLLTSDMIRRT
jgi:hypothetical protein